MESQLQRPDHGHHSDEDDPHTCTGLHSEHDNHGEKKSVLKKVKHKAKKIKDTITKHGHGHGHEQEHHHDDYPERYEEEKEEMVNDPEVHGAPMYDSSVIRITNLPREADDHLKKQGGNQELDQNVRNEARTKGKSNVDEPKAKIGPGMGLEEDPNSPANTPAQTPSNYQSKVTNPTPYGGKEAEVGPLADQFDKLKAHDASNPKPQLEQRFSTDLGTTYLPAQDTIPGKVSSAASAITDKAITAKNVIAAKMGYGGSFHQEPEDSTKKPVLESATEYAHVVYDKVAGAGTAVMSKVQGGDRDKGSSVGEYLSEKFKPGEEDRELSEVITDTLHKQKEAMWKTGEVAEEEKRGPPLGKVTESAEVTARLGPPEEKKREGSDAVASGAESSGQGVADRVKDAVSSWLGKSAGIQTAQESIARSHVSDAAGSGVDEKTK